MTPEVCIIGFFGILWLVLVLLFGDWRKLKK